MRFDGRNYDELRPLEIIKDYLKDVEGSCLIKLGNTHVICTATVQSGAPKFAKDQGIGWVTAEYRMIPRAVPERLPRDKINGRSIEIQRIIGRSLRGACDLSLLNGYTIWIDCDVIQADGGTRVTSIIGGFVALYDAIQHMLSLGMIEKSPIKKFIGAVSVGIVEGKPMLDLTFEEDSKADVDMNVVMTENYEIIELQATGEGGTLKEEDLKLMLELAKKGINEIINKEKEVLWLKRS